MDSLPNNIKIMVLSFCTHKDILSFRLVCKAFDSLFKNREEIWKILLQKKGWIDWITSEDNMSNYKTALTTNFKWKKGNCMTKEIKLKTSDMIHSIKHLSNKLYISGYSVPLNEKKSTINVFDKTDQGKKKKILIDIFYLNSFCLFK